MAFVRMSYKENWVGIPVVCRPSVYVFLCFYVQIKKALMGSGFLIGEYPRPMRATSFFYGLLPEHRVRSCFRGAPKAQVFCFYQACAGDPKPRARVLYFYIF